MWWLIEFNDVRGNRVAMVKHAECDKKAYAEWMQNSMCATKITIKKIDRFQIFS